MNDCEACDKGFEHEPVTDRNSHKCFCSDECRDAMKLWELDYSCCGGGNCAE